MNSERVVHRSVLAVAFAGLLASGAYAQSQDPTPQQQDIQNDKKDLAKDRADRNADQRDINHDKRDLSKDRADRNTDQRDINHDRRDLNKDRVDRNKDQRDINHDKAQLARDDRKFGANSAQAQADRKDLHAD